MKRFLIFTSGRSGSNFLSNTLNLNPECVSYGEVLGEWNLSYKLFGDYFHKKNKISSYLDLFYFNKIIFYAAQLYSLFSHIKDKRSYTLKTSGNIRAIGIKEFLVTLERKNAKPYFINQPDIKIIFLHRSNILKRYVSMLNLRKNDLAYSYKAVTTDLMTVDINDMLEKLHVYNEEKQREQEFVAMLKNHEILDIDYDEYFESEGSIKKINASLFAFLEVRFIETISEQKKFFLIH